MIARDSTQAEVQTATDRNADESRPAGKHVAVIGGGIAGLACAHYLSQGGARVTLLESSAQLGGLGSYFEYQGHTLEKFYHCMLPSDEHLLSLLRDLNLDGDTYWQDTSFGLMHQGQLFGLNTAIDLLRFAPLSWVDRIRVGATGVWGSLRPARGLDDITCEAWLTTLSGKRAFQTFWKPMLQAKFGDQYPQVPALWFWTRFNREKGAKKERKGYLRGGYKRIADTMAKALRGRGVEIQTNCAVRDITLSANGQPTITDNTGRTRVFDKLVYTAPIALLAPLLQSDPKLVEKLGPPIRMQGVINAVLFLKRSLTPHYWVATVDADVPFQGIVESSSLLEKSDSAGHHLIYLMNYVGRSDPLFAASDADILASYLDGLKKLFPQLSDKDVVDAFVFRSPFVEPIYEVGYLSRRPPAELVSQRIFLATSAQVYPQVTSWNGSVGLAKEIAANALNGLSQ